MPKTFKQRLQSFRAYMYNYYYTNVKDTLSNVLFIVKVCILIGFVLLIAIQSINTQAKHKMYGIDGIEINETTFDRYYCLNNSTLKINLLLNKVEVVPNESSDICERK
jgi:hypothetical protein